MPITNEFLDAFKQLVDQYNQSASRGILWKREDSHYESIKNSLTSLLDIITVNKDMFDDLTLVDYLSRSAVKLILSDYQFALAVYQFSINYDKKTSRLNNSSIDTGLYMQINRNDPPTIDLTKQLQNVISTMKKAHASEIAAYDHQVSQLSCENEALKKENDGLKKQISQQLNLQKQSQQFDQVKLLIQKINQIAHINENVPAPNTLHVMNTSLRDELSLTQGLSLVNNPITLSPSNEEHILQIPKPPPPKQEIIKSSICRAHSKIPSSFFQELTTTIQKFEERKKQSSETCESKIEKNIAEPGLTTLYNEIAVNIGSRRKSTKEDEETCTGEELKPWQ